jgi:hypothetical protein
LGLYGFVVVMDDVSLEEFIGYAMDDEFDDDDEFSPKFPFI